MTPLRQILFRLQPFFRRRTIEAELAEELRVHLEMATDANIAAGMSPDEARCAARREFGGIDQVKECYRDERGLPWIEDAWRDLRHSLRGLRRDRAFTITVLAIFALCLAANAVIFILVHDVLLRPLPFRDPDRLVTVFNSYPKSGLVNAGVSVQHYLERKQGVAAFEDAAILTTETITVNATGTAESVEAAMATPSLFQLLGVNAALGRVFTEDESVRGRNHFVLLSDAFWRRDLNADPAVLGRPLRIYNTPYIIVGVLPPEFRFLSHDAELWIPPNFSDIELRTRHACGHEMVARLRPDATVANAQAQVNALDAETLKTDSFAKEALSAGYHVVVRDLHADHVAALRPILLLLQAGVFCLLLIGAVNLANLFMVRATARAREYALRQALGAGPMRLARMILAETLLVSIVGGFIGTSLGAAALGLLPRLAGTALPRESSFQLDPRVVLAMLGLSAAVGFLLAGPVIWLTVRRGLSDSFPTETRTSTTARPVHRLRYTLIVAQIALAFVLLSGAGLLGLSFSRMLAVAPGFRTDHLLSGTVIIHWTGYSEPRQRNAFVSRLLAAVRGLPGVESAAATESLPFSSRLYNIAWEIAGAKGASDTFVDEGMYTDHISSGFFATMGIPLRDGRVIDDADVEFDRKVCVVDEEFALRHWPEGGALGQRIVLPPDPSKPETAREYFTIVGVVGTVKQEDLTDRGAHASLYLPIKAPWDLMVVLRTRAAPEAAGLALRSVLRNIDPELPLSDVKTMTSRIDDSVAGRRTPLLLAGIFAGIAIMLAAVGIYGVLAYSVAQRRREIGVRMALGAQPEQILWQFLGLGVRLLAIGLPLGLIGATLVGRAMAGMLFGIGPANPAVLGGTAAVLAAVAVLSCLLPARRAAQIDPAVALRAE
jgi:predicted permease